MADSQTRQLERRWKYTGSPFEGVSYFRARIRAGELSTDRLKLAAYLGDPTARMALGVKVVRDPPEIDTWIRVLAYWGVEPLIRTLLVAARWNLVKWEHLLLGDRRPRRAIEATTVWLACPCRIHAELASLSADGSSQALMELGDALRLAERDPLERQALYRALAPVAENACRAADLAGHAAETDLRRAADEAVRSVVDCLTAKGMFLRSVELQMREAIARELIPWALTAA